MFIVGFDIDTRTYFTSATTIIAIPTAIKILNWWATIWSGCVFLITSLFFMIGFIFSFSIGGFTGLILANCMIDTLLHDSHSVVGHLHSVSSSGAVYSSFGGFMNYRGLSGQRIYNNMIGWFSFVVFSCSSNLISFSMHFLGSVECPRRILDFGVFHLRSNRSSLIGVLMNVLGFVVLIVLF